MPPLRIYFELDGLEKWHRREWEALVSALAAGPGPGADGVVVDDPASADGVIAPVAQAPTQRGLRRRHPGTGPQRFVWEQDDHPSGKEPGLYCSLPRSLFDPRRHRTFCYPIRYNECIGPGDRREAKYLYGFVGGVTSGLRGRLLQVLHRIGDPREMLLVERVGPWNQMFDRSGLAAKRSYAEALRQCRFFLCPRGNGVGSVRLFETMESARVPVIISDAYVLPSGIDWSTCSVRVRERDLRHIPLILAELVAEWPTLAENARNLWEKHFSRAVMLDSLARNLRELLANDLGENWENRVRRFCQRGAGVVRPSMGAVRRWLTDVAPGVP